MTESTTAPPRRPVALVADFLRRLVISLAAGPAARAGHCCQCETTAAAIVRQYRAAWACQVTTASADVLEGDRWRTLTAATAELDALVKLWETIRGADDLHQRADVTCPPGDARHQQTTTTDQQTTTT